MPGNRRQRRAELALKRGAQPSAGAQAAGALLTEAVRLHRAGRMAEAVERYEQALSLNANIPEALSNLGLALKSLGKAAAAITRFKQALALQPNAPEIWSNLGILLREKGAVDEAIDCFRKALSLKPDYAAAHSSLGNALKDRHRFDEAIACYERALALRRNYPEALTNLGNAVFEMHYSEEYCARSTLDAARLFGRYVAPAHRRTDFANVADPDRRLRVGYVSPDFRNHPVAYLFYGTLAAHDPGEVEVYCYSNMAADDDMTERLRAAAQGWRMIADMSDTEVEATIRRDGIDILVDLAGHTRGNRLPLFALKPAPVQASLQGYLDTTGVEAIDYYIADRFTAPSGDEGSFSETVLHVPDLHFSFAPVDVDIPIVARTADKPLTLGSFNNWAKVSDGTVALWARVLREIPDSRLFLKIRALADPALQAQVVDRFAAHGIGADRLVMERAQSREELLAAYNRVDIGLDPFPYTGCVTTLEALWMGVPVVTLRGKRSVARASEGILTVAGLPNLVAEDADAYVRMVKALAEDRQYLGRLHAGLRTMVQNSPICDCPRFARVLEGLYRGIWKTWCSGAMPS
jgi:predicted O-linked N-acetylglucosamine transferase (SPINDLY family)